MSDPYTESCLAAVNCYLDEQVAKLGHKCQSPIEVGLLRAFITLRLFNRTYRIVGMDAGEIATEVECHVHTQHEVDQYRVDFAVEVIDRGKTRWIAVECDGHDFHEKTKEQAAKDKARDRHLASKGYRMARFTGSEIYRDAMDCVSQVHLIVVSVVREMGA